MFKKYYLAYGSNLNLRQMAIRCPDATPIGRIILENYRLVYRGLCNGCGYLTIEKCEGSTVPLGLYELSYFDIISLDRYEGYPTFYIKDYIPIKIGNKVKKALIYIMNENYNYNLPSEYYLNTCLEGYKNFDFDNEILIKALEDTTVEISKTLKREKI